MPKYLLHANYVGDGVKGLLKEGGTGRRAAATKAVKSIGGKVEAFYFAFGDTDAYLLMDLPDNVSASALAMAVNAAGAVSAKTVVLMTAEDVDAATKKVAKYRPPGK